ncbi:MAG: bifunctional lysylphosphatidylglycerol flippase/synthetase MprF [Hyphomonadaceae bacterium]|nr:bifunctional lysylphosphatidylglycerol flippase/synthetase MprF [Hyphomonadaceae bacterium]
MSELSFSKSKLTLAVPRWVSPLAALALFGGALWIVHSELAAHSFHDIVAALRAIGPETLFLGAALAGASYFALIVAERLALDMIGKPIALARMWRAAFSAYALGNALGFSFATAPAARARLYRFDLAAADIAAVSALTGASVMASSLTAAGLGLFIGAEEVAFHSFGPAWSWRALAIGLMLPAIAWILIAMRAPQTRSVAGVAVRTPRPLTAALQVLVGAGDWVAAAGLLYLLLPDQGGWSFPAFIAVFVLAGALGAVSGAPGGLGVFEASILALSPVDQHAPGALAALVVYRVLYTLAPLGAASLILGHDLAQHSSLAASPAAHTARRLGAAAAELAPRVFAGLSFAGGAILLLSSATPALQPRLEALSRIAPLLVMELSHFLASITGALLLMVAAALWRRLEAGYFAALALLFGGALFALLKGFDYEEALLLALIAAALLPCRSAFTRKSRLVREALSPLWLVAVVGAVAASGWLGFFAYRNVAYQDELWWTFLADAQVSRFLRAAAGVALVVALSGLWVLLSPSRARWRGTPSKTELDRAAAVIAGAETMHSDAHLALVGDKNLLFSSSGASFMMFGVRGNHWIAMGEPCGKASERRELIWRFIECADEADAAPAFYAITEAMLGECADTGLVVRKIGETAVVPVRSFSLEGKARAGLRQARNRVEREGASFEVLAPGAASAHSGEFAHVSDAWLAHHAGAEKAFSLGRFDFSYLDRTPIAVVRREGRIVAFANVWTTPDKRELSVDLMRYGANAPKGVMDYLFVRLIEWGKDQGYAEFDLGMTPLAGLDTHRLAPAFSRIGAVVYAGGESLYGFRGLRAYKQKFDPEWRPLYLAARPHALMAFALLDVALLTSGGWRGVFAKP